MSNQENRISGAQLLKHICENKVVVEYYNSGVGVWEILSSDNCRIVPKPKKDVIKRMFVEVNPTLDNAFNDPNLELTFDSETGTLKLVKIIDSIGKKV